MAKFNLNEKRKETEIVELADNFIVEHETEKGILIKNSDNADAEWFSKAQVKIEGDKIKIPQWLYEKADLFSAGDGKPEED
jgi:hypothetical protein